MNGDPMDDVYSPEEMTNQFMVSFSPAGGL